VTTSMAITKVTVAAMTSPIRSFTGPTWTVRPATVACASGKKMARRGATKSRVTAWKKSLSAPPTKIATANVRSRELILYILHRLFFTIWSHSDHSEKCSRCSKIPVHYLSRDKPNQQVPPYTCPSKVRREQGKKNCSNSISKRKPHEPIRMKPFSGNSENISIRARHLSFRTRM